MIASGRTARCFRTLLAGLLVTATGSSAASPPSTDPGFAEDVRDVLFFHESRPILLRLHVTVDGKPYATRWNAVLGAGFAFSTETAMASSSRKKPLSHRQRKRCIIC